MSLPTELTFGVVTQNIPAAAGQHGDLAPEVVRSVLRKVKGQGALIGLQETIEAEDNAAIVAELSPTNWQHVQSGSENDIAVKRSRFEVKADGRIELHGGKAKVSPNRNATYAEVHFLENPLFTPIIFVDFHLVSGVYKSNDNYQWRSDMRMRSFDILKTAVAKWVQAGYNVLWVADTNWSTMPKLHSAEVRLVDDGIDKIAWIPTPTSNYDLTQDSAPERHQTESDHDARVANVKVTANSLYVPPAPTKDELIEAWLTKNAVSKDELAALQAILAA